MKSDRKRKNVDCPVFDEISIDHQDTTVSEPDSPIVTTKKHQCEDHAFEKRKKTKRASRKSDKNADEFFCSHESCTKCDSDGKRLSFRTWSGVLRHMKKRDLHECSLTEKNNQCQTCLTLKNQMVGNEQVMRSKEFPCRHSQCSKIYRHASSRWKHERDHSSCSDESNCSICRNTLFSDGCSHIHQIRVSERKETVDLHAIQSSLETFSGQLWAYMSQGNGFTVRHPSQFVEMMKTKSKKAWVFWTEDNVMDDSGLPKCIFSTHLFSGTSIHTDERTFSSTPIDTTTLSESDVSMNGEYFTESENSRETEAELIEK